MVSPVIREAILREVEEGKKLVELINSLKASVNEKDAQLSELIEMVSDKDADLTELQEDLEAKVSELATKIADENELVTLISQINVSSVADSVIEEVVNNPEIETPVVVEEAPVPAVDTVPEPAVVEAAMDAMNESEASQSQSQSQSESESESESESASGSQAQAGVGVQATQQQEQVLPLMPDSSAPSVQPNSGTLI